MKTSTIVYIAVPLVAAVLGVVWFFNGPGRSSTDSAPPAAAKTGHGGTTGNNLALPGNLESRLAALESAVARLSKADAGTDASRLKALEEAVQTLKKNFDGVSIEAASAGRKALFTGEEGYLKADEYFEAGKYAIAGEGYLAFLQAHPQHPDAREIMKKARDAFIKAGYKDKAFWVQDEMQKAFPQHLARDIDERARLEKDAGLYAQAAEHMAQAAEMDTSPEERLWKRLYWAWYMQLKDGNAAGVAAMQQVQQEIATSGVTNPKLHERARDKLAEYQLMLQQEQQRQGR